MYPVCTGEAEFRVKETGEILTVTPEQLDWDNEGVGEGDMGGEVRHWATVALQSSKTGKTYTVTWQLWEYPEGVQDNQESDFDPALECLTDFEYGLAHEPEFDEDEAKRDEGYFLKFGENFSSDPQFGGSKVGNAEMSSEVGGNDVKQSAPHALSYLTKARAETLAERDFLGRQHITEALRQLIAEREGTQHFALGLFGSWGSGKSSLVFHLAEQLKKKHPEILIAEFNAWKNEKANNLGAMLAQSVVECLAADLGPWGKLRLAMKLVARRNASLRSGVVKDIQSAWNEILPWLLVFGAPLLSVTVVGVLLWVFNSDLVKLGFGGAAVIATTYKSWSSFLRKNLTEWFTRVDMHKMFSHLKLADYSEHRGLLGEIHRTLGHLCALQLNEKSGCGGKTLLLVVDDLDRCSVNTVKEVFDAVRLVADIPRVITLVAIDERMAFAAVEKHYDQFGHAGRPPANVAREYLGKILQASITLPVVDDEYVQSFVEDVLFSGVDKDRMHKAHSQDSLFEPQTSPSHASKARLTAEASISSDDDLASKNDPRKIEAVALAVTSEPALPEEMDLFRQLAVDYNFRNPRQMGRLYLSWRLLKALRFGGRAYSFDDAKESLRQLFWRELRLQQDADKRDAMDAWLEKCISSGGKPQTVIPILKDIEGAMRGTQIGLSWLQMAALVDSVLLPASRPTQTSI